MTLTPAEVGFAMFKNVLKAGEMAQQLRTLAALSEEQSFVPSTYMTHSCPTAPGSGDLMPSLPPPTPTAHLQTNTEHTYNLIAYVIYT